MVIYPLELAKGLPHTGSDGLALQSTQNFCPMPRFKFQWSNLPADLLRELAWGLGLPGDPVDALKGRFGVRPKDDFVKESWLLLLQFWLSDDQAACDELVGILRAKGLGKTEITDSIGYLRSCNKSAGLRNEVIRLFLALGERGKPQEEPSTTASNDTVHSRRIREEISEQEQHPLELNREGMLTFAKVVVAKMYGVDEDNLFVDKDGDLFIPAGSAGVFVRVNEDPDEFRIFSPLVSNVKESSALFGFMNDINARLRFGHLYYSNENIILEHGLIGRTIDPLQLAIIIDNLTDVADFYDHRLQEKLGGDLFFREPDEDEIEV